MRCLKNKFARSVKKLEGDLAKNGDELERMYAGAFAAPSRAMLTTAP